MMDFSYDTAYFPPIPSVEIRLGIPFEALTSGPFNAIVDTGADITIIPAQIMHQLRTPIDDYRYLRSAWGERQRVAIHSLDIDIGEIRLPAVEIATDESGDDIILGRNILNKLALKLDGPREIISLLE